MPRDSASAVGQRRTAPIPLCSTALMLVGDGAERTAVVIGCAHGIEVSALLDRGWTVIGIDTDPAVHEAVREAAGPDDAARLTTMVADVTRMGRLPDADLVLARSVLLGPDRGAVWSEVLASLAPGGFLAARLLADESARALRGWETLSERHIAPGIVEVVAHRR